MNKKKLLSLVDFLINSYKSSLSSSKIVKALIDSNSFSFIGKAIEEDVLVNNLSISNALRKKNLLPLSFVNVLSACENSGRFVEILQSYSKILQDAIKIEEELRNQKLYFSFILFVFMIGTIIFYFVFNNVTTSLVENKDFFAFKIIKFLGLIFNPYIVSIFVILCIFFIVFISFRNYFLDLFEYYVWGKPYRNVIFSQLMGIWGVLINSAIPIHKALEIAVSIIENNSFRNALISYFSKITDNFTYLDKSSLSKVLDIFPKDYSFVLKNSFDTGNFDEELIKASSNLYNDSIDSLKKRVKAIFGSFIVIAMLLVAALIITIFLSIYMPLMEMVN